MKKKKKKEKKRTLFGENSTLLFLTLEFNGRLNREKERKRRNKRKKEIVHGIRFTIFFFRSRVYTYRENIHLEGNAFRFASKCGTFG